MGLCMLAGYEHSVADVADTLLACLVDPALPLLQFTDMFAVVQVGHSSHAVLIRRFNL